MWICFQKWWGKIHPTGIFNMYENLTSLAINIISSLIVESGKLLKQKTMEKTFENIYLDAVHTCFRDNRKQKEIQKCFASTDFKEKICTFLEKGELVSESYIIELLEPILGLATETYVVSFFNQIKSEITKHPKLAHKYEIILLEENNRLLKLQQENFSIYETAGLTQIPTLPKDFVEPSELCKKINEVFSINNVCLLHGMPGSGKTLAATSIARSENDFPVFWLEFQPYRDDPKLVEKEIQRFLNNNSKKETLWHLLAQSKALYVFDNLQHIKNEETKRLLLSLCKIFQRSEKGGHVLFISRECGIFGASPDVISISVNGLDTKEADILISEKWNLKLSSEISSRVSTVLHGHPQYLLFFYQWLEKTKPSSKTILSYLDSAATQKDEALHIYLVEELYKALGGNDSNTNKLLKAISFFRFAESTSFIENVFMFLGGTNYQDTLSDVYYNRALIQLTKNDYYNIHDILRQFYYHRTDNRIDLHIRVAKLYAKRIEKQNYPIECLETAHHFRKGELYDKSAEAILLITDFCIANGLFWQAFRKYFSHININDLKNEKLKAKCYEAYGYLLYCYSEYESSINLHHLSYQCFNKIGDKYGMARSYGSLGLVYEAKGEWDKAIRFHEKDLELSEEIGDIQGMAQTFNNLGNIYHLKGEWNKAIEFYEKDLKVCENFDDIQGMALTFNNLGNIYFKKGEWDKAITLFKKSLEGKATVCDMHGIANSLNNLGLAYQKKGFLENAIVLYNESLDILKEIGDIHRMATTYGNLGEIYQEKGEFDKAINYLEKYLEISRNYNDTLNEAEALNMLGNVYNTRGESDRAKEFYQQALSIFEKIGSSHGVAVTSINLSDIYLVKRELDEANKCIDQALNIFEKIGDKVGVAKSFSGYGIYYMMQAEYDIAFEFFNDAIRIFEEIGDIKQMSIIYSKLGALKLISKDYKLSLTYFYSNLIYYYNIGANYDVVNVLKCLDVYSNHIGSRDFMQLTNDILYFFCENGVSIGKYLVVQSDEVIKAKSFICNSVNFLSDMHRNSTPHIN